MFVPGNTLLALAGNLTMEELLPRLEAVFGLLPAATPPADKPDPLPLIDSPEVDTVSHAQGDVILFGARFPAEAQKEFAPLTVLFRALALGEGSLLSRRLSEAGLLEAPALNTFKFHRDAGMMACGFLVKPGKAAEAQKLVAKVLDEVRAGGVPAPAIEATRALLHAFFVQQFQNVQVQAAHTLAAVMVLGDQGFYSRVNEMYARVTPADVKAAARHLNAVRYVLVTKK